ncbi:MAG: hypothetical protein Q4B36_08900 [Tissierellia bacterium]|nr:hypothetical protein [Tissierellia bacterium]
MGEDSVKFADPLLDASVELTSFEAYPIILLSDGGYIFLGSSSRVFSNYKIPP